MELLCKFHLQALFFISILLHQTSLNTLAAEPSSAPSPSPELSPASQSPSNSESIAEPPIHISLSPSTSPKFKSLSSLISLTEILAEKKVPDEITKACKSTQYPSECEASIITLNPNPNHDPLTLTTLSIQSLLQALEAAKDSISTPDGTETGDVDDSVNDTCLEMYETAIEDLKSAVNAVAKKEKSDADTKLSSVVTSIDTCDETISEMGADASTFAMANKVLNKMASNTLALANSALGLEGGDEA